MMPLADAVKDIQDDAEFGRYCLAFYLHYCNDLNEVMQSSLLSYTKCYDLIMAVCLSRVCSGYEAEGGALMRDFLNHAGASSATIHEAKTRRRFNTKISRKERKPSPYRAMLNEAVETYLSNERLEPTPQGFIEWLTKNKVKSGDALIEVTESEDGGHLIFEALDGSAKHEKKVGTVMKSFYRAKKPRKTTT